MSDPARPYDIVLLGGTGFTGRLVAEYLSETYGVSENLRWAIAGRSKEKLASVRAEIGNESISVLVADSHDPESLDRLAKQSSVLCNTVGPYALHGSNTVAACVQNGTHYCDLTGEVHWIRRMIDTHHTQAIQKRLRIVHSCGYDSIPSEMSVHFIQSEAMKKFGRYCAHVKVGVKATSGGLSGGTIASLGNMIVEAEQDNRIYDLLADPYGLNPEGMRTGKDGPDLRSTEYDKHYESWKGPFMMSAINTRIVRRGLALMDHPYGTDFRYDEFLLTGKGLSGQIKGRASAMMMRLAAAKPGSLMSRLLNKLAPKPGEGPSRKQRDNGYWVFDILGILPDGRTIRARMKGDKDPGYGSTSKMLGEAAVCLAKDDLPDQFGVITPVFAMGDVLLDRLRANAGISLELKGN